MKQLLSEKDVIDRHNREVFWQIWVPVGAGAFLVLALGILSAFSLQTGSDSAARWSHVATIWLILPVFLIGMISLLFISGLIILMIHGKKTIHQYTPVILYYVQMVSDRIKKLADRSVLPVIKTRSELSIGERLWLSLRLIFLGGFKD